MQVRETLIDVIDIYSLNEDELQGYLGRNIMLLDPVEVYGALQDLCQLLPVPTLVIHTKYWALAFGVHAARYAKSLKSGITMATTRFRLGDDFSSADYLETEGLPSEIEKIEFATTLSKLVGGDNLLSPISSSQGESGHDHWFRRFLCWRVPLGIM